MIILSENGDMVQDVTLQVYDFEKSRSSIEVNIFRSALHYLLIIHIWGFIEILLPVFPVQ